MSTFYTALIEWSDSSRGYVQVFWAWADHIGEAIAKMLACAQRRGIVQPVAGQLDPYHFDTLPASTSTDDEGVTYAADHIHSFPPEQEYQLPTGVIASCREGDYDITDIQTGFTKREAADGLVDIRAVVKADNLLPVYAALISTLDTIRVFWIEFQADWEADNLKAMYVNEMLDEVPKISRFLQSYHRDTVEHGHITLTTYAEQGATNISITDHKIIRVLSYDQPQVEACIQALQTHQLAYQDPLITVEQGIYHWHYRPPLGLDRQGMIDWLSEEGFTYWQP
jgi:hypothetical protein